WPRGQLNYFRLQRRDLPRKGKLRKLLGQKHLDLRAALVRSRHNESVHILLREIPPQLEHPAHMQPALSQGRQDDGVPPGGPSDSDPFVCLVLGEMQLFDAVDDHRWICRRKVEPPGIDLGEM